VKDTPNVVALAGGVGGAKMSAGLARVLPPESLTVVVNTGDDFVHFGLHVSPDLDTVCYTLAGLANPVTGWGRAEETWQAMEAVGRLDGPTWFKLGDLDLATHLERTRRLAAGDRLSQITHDFCRAWQVGPRVVPMSDDLVETMVSTAAGELPFQEYFVRLRCEPEVRGFRFSGVGRARPAVGILEAIADADLVVVCPSNPWVSIDPILAVPGLYPALQTRTVIAVSPIIGGKTVKGPAAKMFREMGMEPTAAAVARHYGRLLDGFVLDNTDQNEAEIVRAMGIAPLVEDTIMRSPADQARLARELVSFGLRAGMAVGT
jgi:LPPG:FO 2-phospho-L-lactate transferase